jgi:hypothetical protein
MKTLTAAFMLSLFASSTAFSQSDSFLTLQEKFSEHHEVCSFSTSGFLGGALFWLAGEHEFYDAIKRVKRLSLITIPRESFRYENVSVTGFKKIVRGDAFEELTSVKDQGDEVTIYMKPTQSKNNRYMILVEEEDNVVVIELTGYIDPDFLLQENTRQHKQKS